MSDDAPFGLRAGVASVAGAHRASNQDSAAAGPAAVFVADGVGGNAGGDVASWTVTHCLAARLPFRGAPVPSEDHLRSLLAQACWDLGARARHEQALTGMSTTFTGLFCTPDPEVLLLAHVGDSRAYVCRDGAVSQVSRDDSLVQSLVEAGVLSRGQAATDPRRNVILASLGCSTRDAAGLTITPVRARPGDRWLLASDGLTDYVDPEEVARLVGRCTSPQTAADALVLAGLAADARDNITAAVVDVVAPTASALPARRWRFAGAAAREDLGAVLDHALRG